MEGTTVIKVKYGETLRRFNARILDGALDLSMDALREKIIGHFKFHPDVELILTYVDEDGDIVTLADDEDLRDVVRQALNPLRITVKSTNEGGSSTKTSGSSTPLGPPRVQQPSLNLNSNVLPKSIQESTRQIIMICADLALTVQELIRQTIANTWADLEPTGATNANAHGRIPGESIRQTIRDTCADATNANANANARAKTNANANANANAHGRVPGESIRQTITDTCADATNANANANARAKTNANANANANAHGRVPGESTSQTIRNTCADLEPTGATNANANTKAKANANANANANGRDPGC